MSQGHQSEVLHCNYNGEIGQKIDLVKTLTVLFIFKHSQKVQQILLKNDHLQPSERAASCHLVTD